MLKSTPYRPKSVGDKSKPGTPLFKPVIFSSSEDDSLIVTPNLLKHKPAFKTKRKSLIKCINVLIDDRKEVSPVRITSNKTDFDKNEIIKKNYKPVLKEVNNLEKNNFKSKLDNLTANKKNEKLFSTMILSSDESDSEDDKINKWKRNKKNIKVLDDSIDENFNNENKPCNINNKTAENEVTKKQTCNVPQSVNDITDHLARTIINDSGDEKGKIRTPSIKYKSFKWVSDDSDDDLPISNIAFTTTNDVKKSFLMSLSPSVPKTKAHQEALKYREDFQKYKSELTEKLFKLFNEKVFNCQLPFDMAIIWNDRLLKTAGYARCTRSRNVRSSSISLSTKILDCATRLRDTLLHEMCHTAVWIIHGIHDGHGSLWQSYARKAALVFPELSVPSRCHTYEIRYKFTYKCTNSWCGFSAGRHSRSVNVKVQFCPACRGTLQCIKNK